MASYTFCPKLYTLYNNLVSWLIRSLNGYVLSKPIKEKVTHSLFIDELKTYSYSLKSGIATLNLIKPCMLDCGLVWNAKKCKICFLKRGKLFDCGEITLGDGMKMKCLEEGETYKFYILTSFKQLQ